MLIGCKIKLDKTSFKSYIIYMKICKQCKKEKPELEFYSHNVRRCKECIKDCSRAFHKDNPQYVRNWQKQNPDKVKQHRKNRYNKYKDYYSSWMIKRRKERQQWLIKYKQSHPCEKCGETNYKYLQFHHAKGRKKGEVSPSEMAFWSDLIQRA